MADLPPRWLLAVVLGASIVVPGFINWVAVQAGYPLVGDVVWVVGFATMVGLVWWGWLRPLDIRGPSA